MPLAGRSIWTPPPEFDDYVLVRRLGSGSSGLVWLAEDAVLARPVAIKFAAAEHLSSVARQRFVVEARAAARVQHPNVVLIYRVGELEDRPYLISEFVRGRTLEQMEKPLAWREALGLAIDLARGLAAAHRMGVLHCDLKPSNAILGDDGTAKIFDFELAIRIAPDAKGADGSTGLSGTPGYMAPEIWRGEGPTRRSDVYALCAILYELCAGKLPFQDVPLARLPWAVQEREAPAFEIEPGPSARFAAVIMRGLRRDAAERFASADELRESLESILRTLSAPVMEGNPYRGLRAFDADHRALFFGRGMEVGVVLDRLRTDACVFIAGDSGVGKSSLCRAGVLPAVREGALAGGREWTQLLFIPGRRPLEALCEVVAPFLEMPADLLQKKVRAEPHSFVRLLRKKLGDDLGLLIFVDQLEEMLTIGDPAETRLVDQALGAMMEGLPGLRMLATLRADFLSRFVALEDLSADLSRVLYFLRPLSPDRIREAILGPAAATGARFETPGMVEALVESTANAQGGLPLLQFALAELWESREAETGVITERALAAAGGVGGALTRHADAVLGGLLPLQRTAARRMLLRLVTLEGTRARRTGIELAAEDGPARAALDALVRGRLLVAQDADEGSAYELAHEVLVNGWGTLKRWLSEEAANRAVRGSLSQQAADWQRLGRKRDGLLSAARLREIDALKAEDLTPVEQDLLAATRRSLLVRRWVRGVLIASIPVVAIAAWLFARAASRTETYHGVETSLSTARGLIAAAHDAATDAENQRKSAFAHFDHLERAAGETDWARALVASTSADKRYAAASRALEAALAQDPSRTEARDRLADVLYEEALLAEANNLDERRDELVERFSVYDLDGSRIARWKAPAELSLATPGVAADATLLRLSNGQTEALGKTPIAGKTIAPGSYLVTLQADGRAPVRFPFIAARNDKLSLDLALPLASAVPEPFVYLPPGKFLFGSSADEDTRKGFFNTVPLHTLESPGFLISRYEITYADWLAYLDALPDAERKKRTPFAAAKGTDAAPLTLQEIAPKKWQLTMPSFGAGQTTADLGAPLTYPGRTKNAQVDWRKLPVTGISALDVEAYVAWLRKTSKLPGARMCTEAEWERAARGADGRAFPGGAELKAGDANLDDTYSRQGMGPDEVGTHPASRSPFSVDDMSGNAFEWTFSVLEPGQYVGRGGSYFHDRKTAQLANRELSTETLRDVTLGARVCADLQK